MSANDKYDSDAVVAMQVSPGARMIAEARAGHMAAGHDAKSDALYVDGQLVEAANAYIFESINLWPWPDKSFTLRSRISNLRRAGAFLAAEIDRLVEIEAGLIGVRQAHLIAEKSDELFMRAASGQLSGPTMAGNSQSTAAGCGGLGVFGTPSVENKGTQP